MLIPRFWAEARLQHRQNGKQTTLRRWGWSDDSQAHAQTHAQERVQGALQGLLAGQSPQPREPRRAYNGAAGVPIREEIIDTQGSAVLTRNSYGALCLNTPNVLFADVDFAPVTSRGWLLATVVLQIMVVLLCINALKAWGWGGWSYACALLAAVVLGAASRLLHRSVHVALGITPEALARQRISQFMAAHPQWALRVYRTPAGLRLLATHRVFDPHDPEVAEFFAATRTDPVYAAMCRHQHCFRARVSAKPWRITLQASRRLPQGVWPTAPEYLPQRQQWVAAYEKAASAYAACVFESALGTGAMHMDVQPVVQWHDQLSAALQNKPLA